MLNVLWFRGINILGLTKTIVIVNLTNNQFLWLTLTVNVNYIFNLLVEGINDWQVILTFFFTLCWYCWYTIFIEMCSRVSFDLKCVANLNSNERKITSMSFKPSTARYIFNITMNLLKCKSIIFVTLNYEIILHRTTFFNIFFSWSFKNFVER